jgi:hypothetical protein
MNCFENSKQGLTLQILYTKVIVAYGWDSAGDDTATLDADGSVQLGVKPDGDADTSDSTGKAELDGNGNGNGHDFVRIIAFDVTNRAWDRQNQLGPTGEVFNETGHRNFGDYLNYNSYNEGKGRDTFHSAVNGSLQPTGNATFKIDASGNSLLRVASDNEFAKHTTAWRSDTPVVWLGNSQGNDAQFTELTNTTFCDNSKKWMWQSSRKVQNQQVATRWKRLLCSDRR